MAAAFKGEKVIYMCFQLFRLSQCNWSHGC